MYLRILRHVGWTWEFFRSLSVLSMDRFRFLGVKISTLLWSLLTYWKLWCKIWILKILRLVSGCTTGCCRLTHTSSSSLLINSLHLDKTRLHVRVKFLWIHNNHLLLLGLILNKLFSSKLLVCIIVLNCLPQRNLFCHFHRVFLVQEPNRCFWEIRVGHE